MTLTVQRFQHLAVKAINRYGGGHIAFASYADTVSVNPYDLSTTPTPSLIGSFPAISMRELNAKQCEEEFGLVDGIYYRATFANPSGIEIPRGCFALANFSEGTQIVAGVLQRLDPKLSGQVDAYINSSRQVPFDFTEILGEKLWLL